MDPGGRVLVCGADAVEIGRIEASVRAAAVPGAHVESVQSARAAAALGDGHTWDAVVAASDALGDELSAALAREPRVDVVLAAADFDERVATLAHRLGARVCLASHAPATWREAIEHATRDTRARRERAVTERALRARENVRVHVAVSVADVIFLLGVEGDHFRFLEINPAFSKATGLSEAQVVGKLVADVIPEPSLSLVRSKYRQAIAERRTVRWIETTEYPTGTKYGEVSVTPVVDADGRCTSLVGTVHDVTEERERGEIIRRYGDIVRAVDIGLTVWSVPDSDHPARAKLLACNPAAERVAGFDLGARLGAPLGEAFPPKIAEAVAALVGEVAKSGETKASPEQRFDAGGAARVAAIKAFPLPGGCVGVAIEDVSLAARARALAAAEHHLLEMVAQGASLGDTLAALACAIEEHADGALASVLLVSADGKRFTTGAAPHLPFEYARAFEGQRVGAATGACGLAVAQRRRVVVADVETDPVVEVQRPLARSLGLRACWAAPILAGDARVLGAFALHHKTPREPSPVEFDLLARATHVAGIAIQRHQLDQQLRALSARIEAAREEERSGIAREIHDQLGQQLTAMKMDLAWIARRAEAQGGIAKELLLAKIEELSEMTGETIDQVRRISSELRPGVLDDLGLVAALKWEAKEFEKRTRIPVAVRAELGDESPGRDVSTAVFRVFQEALTNVVRHADAKHVEVVVEAKNGWLEARVQDDGKGIGAADAEDPRSLGLLGIRERARRLGGTASFARATPCGTMVTLRLPIAPASTRA